MSAAADNVNATAPEGPWPPDSMTVGDLRAAIAARMGPMTLDDLSRAAAAEFARRRDIVARMPAGDSKGRRFRLGLAAWGHVCMAISHIDGTAER